MKALKSKIMEWGILLLQAGLLAGITIFSVIPMSCKVTTEGIEIIGADYVAPVLEAVTVVDDKTVELQFSESIKMSSYVVTPVLDNISDSNQASYNQDVAKAIRAAVDSENQIDTTVFISPSGKKVTFLLNEKTVIGKKYEVYGTVEDRIGNTLTFCVPFTGYNSSVPDVIMTEVQIKYSKGTSGGETVFRNEYVELLALTSGNLSGLVLESAMDGEAKKYFFPAINVRKGEVLVVHLRTAGEGCVNEDGDDLNLAGAAFSTDGIRDLWSENTSARLHDNSDVLVLKDTISGVILDGFMYAAEGESEWKPVVEPYANAVCDAGIYPSPLISDATKSKGASPTKSFTRVDAGIIYQKICAGGKVKLPSVSGGDNWIITAATPGLIKE